MFCSFVERFTLGVEKSGTQNETGSSSLCYIVLYIIIITEQLAVG